MKQIPLTQGQIALVDDEDFERVSQHKWYASKKYRNIFLAQGWVDGKRTLMHRFIMDTPQNMVVDHINHNTLDNRKSNLRNCYQSDNLMNQRARRNNKLGIKNIYFFLGGYRTQVKFKGKYVLNKWFPTLEEAIEARDEAIKKYHGEFANTD